MPPPNPPNPPPPPPPPPPPASTAATPPSATAATHAAKDGPDQEARAHSPTTASTRSASKGSRQDTEKKNPKNDQQPEGTTAIVVRVCWRSLPELWRARQCYALIIRDVFRQLPCGRRNPAAVISPAEIRHHQTPCIPRPRIINNGFQPVPHL